MAEESELTDRLDVYVAAAAVAAVALKRGDRHAPGEGHAASALEVEEPRLHARNSHTIICRPRLEGRRIPESNSTPAFESRDRALFVVGG